MKKLFAVLVVIALVASVASAQLINAGPKVQLNFASAAGDYASSYTSATFIGFGGFATYKVNPIDVVGELLYNVKGTGVSGSDNKMSLTYLDINILAKYSIPMDGNIKPAVFAGLNLGILMAANAHSNGGDVDIKDQMSGTDFGIIIGIGASYIIGTGAILLDVRYDLGLATIQKNTPPSNKNSVLSIAVGYAFDLK
jgi:hypothetical protein